MQRHPLTHQPRRRAVTRLLVVAVVITGLAVWSAAPVAAAGGVGAALGMSSYADDGHTANGSGSFALAGGNNDGVNVMFQCTSNPAPTTAGVPVNAGIAPPAHNGCVLVRNGSRYATAPGLALGPVGTTGAVVSMPWMGTSSLQVCWNTFVVFADGYNVATSGCSTISYLDNLPTPQTSDGLGDEDVLEDGGFVFIVGTGGQNESGRVICASTTGTTSDCQVGVTGTGASSNNDASISGTGPANGECNWVCFGSGGEVTNSTLAISATNQAGTTNCPNTAIAISTTGDACASSLALSGTGNSTANTAISGTGYATGSFFEWSGREELCTQAQLMC